MRRILEAGVGQSLTLVRLGSSSVRRQTVYDVSRPRAPRYREQVESRVEGFDVVRLQIVSTRAATWSRPYERAVGYSGCWLETTAAELNEASGSAGLGGAASSVAVVASLEGDVAAADGDVVGSVDLAAVVASLGRGPAARLGIDLDVDSRVPARVGFKGDQVYRVTIAMQDLVAAADEAGGRIPDELVGAELPGAEVEFVYTPTPLGSVTIDLPEPGEVAEVGASAPASEVEAALAACAARQP